MSASEASNLVPDETFKDVWEELMGRDLMMMKYTSDSCPVIFRNLPPLDADFCTDHDQDCAEIGDYAVISYVGYFSKKGDVPIHDMKQLKQDLETSGSHLIKFIQARDWIIKLGSGNVVPALEMATRFLVKGESAIVKCHSKYAYSNGRVNSCLQDDCHQDLPANTTSILFQITLREIIPLGNAFKPEFRLKLGIHLKVMGNDAYKYEWIPTDQGGHGKINALKLYGDASQELTSLMKDDKIITSDNMNEEIKLQCIKNLVDCFNNIASVHLRAKDYGKAKEAATEAIKIDPDNVKALCKAAKASLMMANYEECKAVLDVLQNLDETNKDVLRLRKEFYQSRRIHKKKEKALFSKMMAHIAQASETKTISKETNTIVIQSAVHAEQDAKHTVTKCKQSPLSGTIPIILLLIGSIITCLYLKYVSDATVNMQTDL
jgi:tetratricopeptide (TPR) repeat protein